MTEETQVENQQEETTQENNSVNITVEQILAGILQTVNEVTVPLETLITDYSNKKIAVTQNEDKSVRFTLVDASEVAETPEAE